MSHPLSSLSSFFWTSSVFVSGASPSFWASYYIVRSGLLRSVNTLRWCSVLLLVLRFTVLSMAGSSSSSGTISISNIASLISLKLDRDNYLLWKSQFLHTNKLLQYVDGSASCPAQFMHDKDGKMTSTINAAYDLWVEQDSLVLLWINATLRTPVVQRVVGLQSAREVWQRLETLHLIQSRSRVLQLKQQFQNLKRGGLSITDYLDKMKSIADALEAIALASNPMFHARTKHVEVDYHFIREKVICGDIQVRFVGTIDQLADIFTKGLSTARFQLLMTKLHVIARPPSLRGSVSRSDPAQSQG